MIGQWRSCDLEIIQTISRGKFQKTIARYKWSCTAVVIFVSNQHVNIIIRHFHVDTVLPEYLLVIYVCIWLLLICVINIFPKFVGLFLDRIIYRSLHDRHWITCHHRIQRYNKTNIDWFSHGIDQTIWPSGRNIPTGLLPSGYALGQ